MKKIGLRYTIFILPIVSVLVLFGQNCSKKAFDTKSISYASEIQRPDESNRSTNKSVPDHMNKDVLLTSDHFYADSFAPKSPTLWALNKGPIKVTPNTRLTIIRGSLLTPCKNGETEDGKFVTNGDVIRKLGKTRQLKYTHKHRFDGLEQSDPVYVPGCKNRNDEFESEYGPSFEGDIRIKSGEYWHLLKNIVPAQDSHRDSFISNYDEMGQGENHANKHILPIYTNFKPEKWKMKPWEKLYAIFRSMQKVPVAKITDFKGNENPQSQSIQQVQQTLRFVIANKNCFEFKEKKKETTVACKLEFNFKIFMKGSYSLTAEDDAYIFTDHGQSGMFVVIGPINKKTQTTRLNGHSIYTSWGEPTQNETFSDPKNFQIEMTWSQFKFILNSVSENNPRTVFGKTWNDNNDWYLLDAGYGQENVNTSWRENIIEGLIKNIEVISRK
jgi:hypothetical protein